MAVNRVAEELRLQFARGAKSIFDKDYEIRRLEDDLKATKESHEYYRARNIEVVTALETLGYDTAELEEWGNGYSDHPRRPCPELIFENDSAWTKKNKRTKNSMNRLTTT